MHVWLLPLPLPLPLPPLLQAPVAAARVVRFGWLGHGEMIQTMKRLL
jgi:hypothetical protein